MKKKFFTLMTTIVFASMCMLQGVSASEREPGNLSWDFENKSDIAYSFSGQAVDTGNSGAWIRQNVKHYGTHPQQVTLPAANEVGGNYCAKIANGTLSPRTIGMCIQLSEKELIPGKTYNLTFDAYSTETTGRAIYAGFSKPSDRPVKPGNTTEYPWFTSVTPNRTHAKSGEYETATSEWRTFKCTVTPEKDFYENGFIAFYIAGGDTTGKNTKANEELCLDNISIVATDIETNDDIVYSTVSYGKTWSFEDTEKAQISNSLDDGKWTKLKDILEADEWKTDYVSVEGLGFGNTTTGSAATEYPGASAPGSTQCLIVGVPTANTFDATKFIGTRIKISNQDFKVGETYVLNLYGASTSGAANRDLSVCVTPCSDQKDSYAYNEKMTWYDSCKKERLGTVTKSWNTYSAEITLSDTDFDGNGEAIIWILAHAPNLGNTSKGEKLYLDNISLTLKDAPTVVANSTLECNLTTVRYDNEEPLTTYAALFGEDVLANCKVLENTNKIDEKSFTMEIGNVTNPAIKLFVWDEDLKPVAKTPITVGK